MNRNQQYSTLKSFDSYITIQHIVLFGLSTLNGVQGDPPQFSIVTIDMHRHQIDTNLVQNQLLYLRQECGFILLQGQIMWSPERREDYNFLINPQSIVSVPLQVSRDQIARISLPNRSILFLDRQGLEVLQQIWQG